jgi:hypothetical protein
MPLKVNVGLSKKIGLPDYGSLGASCHVEYEADSTLLQTDLDTFHKQVKSAFVACRQAVQDELYREQNGQATPQRSNGQQAAKSNGRSNGQRHGRKATQSQLRALDAIANRLQLNLANWLHERYGLQLAKELTIKEASDAIDELNSAPASNGGSR